MYHLVVVAHPVETSFTMALARAYADELDTVGHAVRVRDLYRMDFDPVLAPDELGEGGLIDPIVAQGRDDLREADALTVFYPLWWLSMPAMLKGYVDRVFERTFASGAGPGTGKQCALVTLSASPRTQIAATGRWNALESLQDTYIFSRSGFDLVEHLHFDEIVPALPDDTARRYLIRMRQFARKHFG